MQRLAFIKFQEAVVLNMPELSNLSVLRVVHTCVSASVDVNSVDVEARWVIDQARS